MLAIDLLELLGRRLVTSFVVQVIETLIVELVGRLLDLGFIRLAEKFSQSAAGSERRQHDGKRHRPRRGRRAPHRSVHWER